MTSMAIAGRMVGWVRERGPFGAAIHAARVAGNLAAQLKPANRADARRKAEEERNFDRVRGVQTAGILRLNGLELSGARADGQQYGTISASAFREMMKEVESLGFPVASSTFVDLGCGKGKILLLAAEWPFGRVVGVEFARSLAEVARGNIAADRLAGQRKCRSVEAVWGDATEYTFPPGSCLIFLYNPFGPIALGQVLRRLVESLLASPRPAMILYVNPAHHALLVEHDFEPIVEEQHYSIYCGPIGRNPPGQTASVDR